MIKGDAKAGVLKARVTDDIGSRTGDTRGMIYPASGPRRENPTCCLSDLVLMMMYSGAARDLVERDLSNSMRGGILGCVLDV